MEDFNIEDIDISDEFNTSYFDMFDAFDDEMDNNFGNEEEAYSLADKIMTLSDELSEEIILKNIQEQFDGKLDVYNARINYMTLFTEKYKDLDKDNPYYDRQLVIDIVHRVADTVLNNLKDKFGVELEDFDNYTSLNDYLTDVETLYEMFVVRNFENLENYFKSEIVKNQGTIYERYIGIYKEERHYNDIFAEKMRNKFKNERDVIILHFLEQIIDDIVDEAQSLYSILYNVTNQDRYEEFNMRFSTMLILYGNKINFEDDLECAKKYLKIITDSYELRSELKNSIMLSYLDEMEG